MTNTTRVFTLPEHHTCSLIHTLPKLLSQELDFPFRLGDHFLFREAGKKFCPLVQGSSHKLDLSQVLRPRSLSIPWHFFPHPSLISGILLPAESLNLSPRPLLFRNPSCHQLFFPEPDLANLISLCAKAQHVLSLLSGGSASRLFINKLEDLGHATYFKCLIIHLSGPAWIDCRCPLRGTNSLILTLTYLGPRLYLNV